MIQKDIEGHMEEIVKNIKREPFFCILENYRDKVQKGEKKILKASTMTLVSLGLDESQL